MSNDSIEFEFDLRLNADKLADFFDENAKTFSVLSFDEFIKIQQEFLVRPNKIIKPICTENNPTKKAIFEKVYALALKKYYSALNTYEQKKQQQTILNSYNNDKNGYVQYVQNAIQTHQSFYLGRNTIPIKEHHRQRHTYITGTIGSGKSEMIKSIIWHYITKNTNTAIVLIAPESDICVQVAQFKPNKNSNRLVYIKPTIDGVHFPCFNFFEFENKETMSVLQAEKYAKDFVSVFQELAEGEEAEITANMNMILLMILPILIKYNNATIYDFLEFIKPIKDKEPSEKQKEYIAFANTHFSSNRNMINFLNGEFITDKDLNSSKTAIYRRFYSLFNSSIIQNFFAGKSTFDLKKLILQKKVIVFDLPKGEMGERDCYIIGKFLVAKLKILAFENNPNFYCHLFVDECHNFITKSFLSILEECRKFRLFLTLVQQQVGQRMNSELLHSILSNTGIKITGLNGYDSLTKIAKSVGVSTEAMQEILKQGVFLLSKPKFANEKTHSPIFINAPTNTLKDKQSMTKEDWQALQFKQIQCYYCLKTTPQDDNKTHQEAEKTPDVNLELYLN